MRHGLTPFLSYSPYLHHHVMSLWSWKFIPELHYRPCLIWKYTKGWTNMSCEDGRIDGELVEMIRIAAIGSLVRMNIWKMYKSCPLLTFTHFFIALSVLLVKLSNSLAIDQWSFCRVNPKPLSSSSAAPVVSPIKSRRSCWRRQMKEDDESALQELLWWLWRVRDPPWVVLSF